MRCRSRPVRSGVVVVTSIAATLAGCSSSGTQSSLTTSSLAPRPSEGIHRTYPDGSTYGRPYTVAPQRTAYTPQRRYVDPGTPTPRHVAQTQRAPYGQPSGIQTASIGPSGRGTRPNYDPNARWQQPSPIITGSAGPASRPQNQRPVVPRGPHVVEVREGDTLYGISRTHRVPLHDIVAANRLTSDRIEIGQRIVIPSRPR